MKIQDAKLGMQVSICAARASSLGLNRERIRYLISVCPGQIIALTELDCLIEFKDGYTGWFIKSLVPDG